MPKGQKNELTFKQKRFVDFYDGNATEAAAKAGYKGNRHTLEQVGLGNMRKPVIADAIAEREKKTLKSILLAEKSAKVFGLMLCLVVMAGINTLINSEILRRYQPRQLIDSKLRSYLVDPRPILWTG